MYDPVVCDPGGLYAGVLDWEGVCDLVVTVFHVKPAVNADWVTPFMCTPNCVLVMWRTELCVLSSSV